MRQTTTWSFPEEFGPCGTAGSIRLTCGYTKWMNMEKLGVNDILAVRVKTHPWFVILWEPLLTKAPGPHLTIPYCCYANTVVFYVRPYTVRLFTTPHRSNGFQKWSYTGPRRIYQEWDSVEHRIRNDDLIEFEGEYFKAGPGQVMHRKGAWWMRHWARRQEVNTKPTQL